MKRRTPFMFAYANGHDWREFSDATPLKGIRIAPETIILTQMISDKHAGNEAASRGLLPKEYKDRSTLLSEDDLLLLRCHCAEFNGLLRDCNADFRVPLDGPCWIEGDDRKPRLVDFKTGEGVKSDRGWALYKYLA